MNNTAKLLRFEEVAKSLDVPAPALRKVADDHGLTIMIGRSVRLHPDDLGRLIEKCRVVPKVRASSGAKENQAESQAGRSETAQPACPPALAAAKMLKGLSRRTSSGSTAQLVQLHPRK